DTLSEKLGPLLFQFGYLNKKAFVGINDFLARLRPFLKKLPKDHRFAVEIRNKNWLVPQFVETLRERSVALALIDQSWMPRPAQWFEKLDPITADFTYVRWLGDRKGIEERTKIWNEVIVDRSHELSEWAEILGKVHKRKIQIYAYANNHYAGYSPATVEMFQGLWRRQVKEETKRAESSEKGMTLFPLWAFGSSFWPAPYGPISEVTQPPMQQKRSNGQWRAQSDRDETQGPGRGQARRCGRSRT